ncbi:MAG: aminotransferase class IV family protein [Hyphomicrobiales bacterium]|nr:aminotransferase class IV family protein [Hyphomicrobiales bacterium]
MPAEGALRDGTSPGFELIETLRWEPAGGFVRLARHLERLHRSADVLGFAYDATEVERVLERCAGGRLPLRVRLTLDSRGSAAATTAPFEPLPQRAVWTLRLARTQLRSAEPRLRHKTTLRSIYEAARAEFSRDDADEVLLSNERGEVCEGTITSLFADVDNGVLLTPALRCGLLPGVLRGEMIEQGQAREAVLTMDDLDRAKALYVGNSLRGLIEARLDRDP